MAWPPRYTILALLFLLSLVNYIDRVNISITAPVMMPELGWDTARFGIIFSAFVCGYALFMIPSGLLADTRSPKSLLAVACFGWSLFTLLTPLGQYAFVGMLGLRFLVGAFEAVSLPATTVLNSRWVPKHELGIAQMISLSGVYAGQLIAYPLSAWILAAFSWREVFYLNALAGFVWILVWLWYGADRPPSPTASLGAAEHPQSEQCHASGGERAERVRVPLRVLLGTPAVMALAVSYFFWAYGLAMVVAWLPTYLVQARGFSIQQMGWVGMFPVAGGLLGVLGGGMLSDHCIRRGVSPTWARKGIPAIAIALSAPFLVVATAIPSATVAVIGFALFQLITTIGLVAYWSIPVEMSTRLAGSIASIMNFGGNFGGFFSPMVAGFLVKATNDWALPFYSAAVGCLVGAVVLATFVPVRPLAVVPRGDEERPPSARSHLSG
ncbi:MAG: MFS transporter [Candidatus Binatia bacterium]|nr:MFS transporter [Candidatus Binatia bacterium]